MGIKCLDGRKGEKIMSIWETESKLWRWTKSKEQLTPEDYFLLNAVILAVLDHFDKENDEGTPKDRVDKIMEMMYKDVPERKDIAEMEEMIDSGELSIEEIEMLMS